MALLFDAVIILLIGWLAVRGYRKGLIRQILGLISIGLAGVIATLLYASFATVLAKAGVNQNLVGVVGFLGIFIPLLVVFCAASRWVAEQARKRPSLSTLDRMSGAVVGVAAGGLLFGIVLRCLAPLPIVGPAVNQSLAAPCIVYVGFLVQLLCPSTAAHEGGVSPPWSPGNADSGETDQAPDGGRNHKYLCRKRPSGFTGHGDELLRNNG